MRDAVIIIIYFSVKKFYSETREKRKNNVLLVTFRKSVITEGRFSFFGQKLVLMLNYWSDFSDVRRSTMTEPFN